MRGEKGAIENVMIRKRKALFLQMCGAVLALILIACSEAPRQTSKGPAATPAAEKAAWDRINQGRLLARIKVLSSDEFEGRASISATFMAETPDTQTTPHWVGWQLDTESDHED